MLRLPPVITELGVTGRRRYGHLNSGQNVAAKSGTVASSAVPSEKLKNTVLALIRRKGTITCILDMGDDHEVSFFCVQFYRKTAPNGPP